MMVRIARLFDGTSVDTGPYFSHERERLEAEERRAVVEFLASAVPIQRTTVNLPDALDPRHPRNVPVAFLSDGNWVWSQGVGYYVDKYGIAPEPEFLEYIRTRNYTCPTPDQNSVDAALAALREYQSRARPAPVAR